MQDYSYPFEQKEDYEHLDAHNLPFVQKGMNSPAYRGLWCGEQERRIIHFHQVVDRLIMEGGGQVPNYKE